MLYEVITEVLMLEAEQIDRHLAADQVDAGLDAQAAQFADVGHALVLDRLAHERGRHRFRITSYNVCYTKLLRLAAAGRGQLAGAQAVRVHVHARPGRVRDRPKPFIKHDKTATLGGKAHRFRITSYNVCYTKLLRI